MPKESRRKAAHQAARKRAPKKTYKPTYSTAAKVARIAIRLQMPPRQLSFGDVRDIVATRVSDRTIERYIDALEKVFNGRERYPLLEIEKHERGTEELATWVMSMAPWVEVVKPELLRAQMKKMLEEGLKLYA